MKFTINQILDAYDITESGIVIRKSKNKRLVNIIDHYGYEAVRLSINNIQETWKVHRLVAMTYLQNPLNKPEVNHKNGIKTDNYVSNLEWVTNQENTTHKIKNGLSDHGVMRKCNRSGHVGVYWDKINNKYRAQIQINKKKRQCHRSW